MAAELPLVFDVVLVVVVASAVAVVVAAGSVDCHYQSYVRPTFSCCTIRH